MSPTQWSKREVGGEGARGAAEVWNVVEAQEVSGFGEERGNRARRNIRADKASKNVRLRQRIARRDRPEEAQLTRTPTRRPPCLVGATSRQRYLRGADTTLCQAKDIRVDCKPEIWRRQRRGHPPRVRRAMSNDFFSSRSPPPSSSQKGPFYRLDAAVALFLHLGDSWDAYISLCRFWLPSKRRRPGEGLPPSSASRG